MCAVLIIAGSCNIDPVDFINKFQIKKNIINKKSIALFTILFIGLAICFRLVNVQKTICKKEKKSINYHNEKFYNNKKSKNQLSP